LALVVGCDMPFLNPNLLWAFAGWAEGFDVAVLRHVDGEQADIGRASADIGRASVEPLHAAYRRTCLPAMEAVVRAGQRRIVSFFPQVRVRYVTPAEVMPFDPDLRSFRNVNTPEEWAATRAVWGE
jgi:molybdopterin-guanine dinucleotide biosynthesis protein A